MAEPWFSGYGINVGPLTLTDEQRRQAALDLEKKKALQRELAVRQQAGNMYPGKPQSPMPEVMGPPMPTSSEAWGYGTDPAIHPSENPRGIPVGVPDVLGWLKGAFPETYNLLSGAPRPAQVQAGIPPVTDPSLPATGPILPDRPGPAITPAVNATPAPNAAPAKEDPIDRLLSLLEAPDPANPKQDKADQFADREMKRTALLAQLAFASGLTKAGGAGWQEVGEGFSAAAGVYDKGFQRYQSALQDSADRYAASNEKTQNKKIAIAKTRVDIAQEQQKNMMKTWEDRMETIDKMFGKELDSMKSDLEPPSQDRVGEVMRRWQLAKERGQYVPPTINVSD